MESGFSSPRSEAFPAGLRVLVVDDDLAWLKILERMLKKCNYEVTTCGLARDALRLLRERKDGYDIVISDVNMPDMDGFKLLEHVGLEMDLPVIMMSVDGETSRVMKGVQHGACDYLLKPIRMKELRNIWQHVYRKRMHEVRDIEGHESFEDLHLFCNGSDLSDGYILSAGDHNLLKKRKDIDNKHEDRDGDPSSKKPRVVWSVDLHQKFVKAVNQIGFDKVGPKKILDLMNVPGLTRENVASHLQKYRLYLSRLQKGNESKLVGGTLTCGALKSLDLPPKDTSVGFGLQSCTVKKQNNIVATNMRSTDHKLPVKNVDSSQSTEYDPNLLPLTDPTKPLSTDASSTNKASSTPVMLNCSFGLLDSPISSQYQWSAEISETHFKYEHNLHHPLEDGLSNPLLNVSPQIIPTYHGRSICESNKGTAIQFKPLKPKQSAEPYSLDLGPFPESSFDKKDDTTSKNSTISLESDGRNQISEIESAFGCLTEDLRFHWLQDDNFTANIGFESSPEIVTQVPFHLYGAPKLDYEYLYDLFDHPSVDQGLFIS